MTCLVDGIDGKVRTQGLPHDDRCPINPCMIDDCAFICAFINAALPDGPLWDDAKARFNEANIDGCFQASTADFCSDLAGHAAFVAKSVLYHIRSAIWPAMREANPFTAVTTRQYWLDHWGWDNCFLRPDRSTALGELTPYEVAVAVSCDDPEEQGSVGVVVDTMRRVLRPPVISDDLQNAINQGLIVALARRSLGAIPNEANLNFIASSLAANIVVHPPIDVWSAIEIRQQETCVIHDKDGHVIGTSIAGVGIHTDEEQGVVGGFDPVTGPFAKYCRCPPAYEMNDNEEQGQGVGGCCVYMPPVTIEIQPLDSIAVSMSPDCPTNPRGIDPCHPDIPATIPSYIDLCDPSMPARIYPAALAAECIIRSIFGDTQNIVIVRCPPVDPYVNHSCPPL